MDKWESSSILTSDLYNTSFLSLDDDYDLIPWIKILQHLNDCYLNALKASFKEKCYLKDPKAPELENGLTKEEFLNTISEVFGDDKYVSQAIMMFNEIDKENKGTITWALFIDFMYKQLKPSITKTIDLCEPQIISCPHAKREIIIKIISIETQQHFCYGIISKHGCVGLYDGNMNFLTSYTVLMNERDIELTDEERRRKNRWITDAIFIVEVLMLVVTNTARSMVIYDASNLHHIPLWLILGIPNTLHCLTSCFKLEKYILYAGNECGEIISFHFLQPDVSLFRKNQNDKMTSFYWPQLKNEKEFVIIKNSRKIHADCVRDIEYFSDNHTIVTCSRDTEKSVIIKSIDNRIKPYIFKMKRGANCFYVSKKMKLLVTGSEDGVIRIWNLTIVSQPLFTLSHKCGIIHVIVIDSQKVLVSVSRDGVLKLWDLKEYVCIKTIKIKFPPFKEMGKTIEWGRKCIFPGPKRTNKADLSNLEICSDNDKIWERTNILISCCNYVASIKFDFLDGKERNFNLSVLPAPPLQNSVLIPNSWKVSKDDTEIKVESVDIDDKLKQYIESLNFILEKDFLSEENFNNDINFKIARLENTKLKMKGLVAQGAPYLALDLPDVEEIKLSPNLPLPNKKKNRYLVEKTQKMLADVGARSLIFSSPSSSTRSKSSRTSIIEFN